jgi:hypothetical protein
VLLLVVTFLVVCLGSVAITVFLAPDSVVDAVVTFGVVTSSWMAIAVELPGLVGLLHRSVVVAVSVLPAPIALVVLARSGRRPVLRRDALLHALRRLARAGREAPATAALCAVSSVAVAWQAVVAVVLAPYAYDALTYHLVAVVTWMQSHRLAESALTPCCAHYPLTPELLFAWPMVITRSDAAVNLVQVAFIVLGAFAVAGLARSLGARGPLVAFAGAAFAATPIVLAQGPTEFVDVMIASWTLAALHSTVRFVRAPDVRRVVPAALATGLLLGSKGTGLIWAVAIGATLLVAAVWSARRHVLTVRGAASAIAVVALACVALGSFWYVRNVAEHGNPVYPFRLAVAGVVIFDGPERLGPIQEATSQSTDPWPIQVVRNWRADLTFWNQHRYSYEQRSGGLGPIWAWVGAPLTLAVVVIAIRRRDATLLVLLLVGIVFVLQPYRWWSRFTIPLAGVGAVSVGIAAGWRGVGKVVRAAVLVLGCVGIVLVVGHVNPASRATPIRPTKVLSLATRPRSSRLASEVFFPEYGFVSAINRGETVVADLDAEPLRFVYLLYGGDLDRRVTAFRPGAELRDRWVITSRGRQADAAADDGAHMLVSDRRGVRAWKPTSS